MNRTARLSIAAIDWPLLVMGTLGLWLSGSLVVDLLVVPSLSAAGMMSQPGFISAGHLLFSIFNHLEMLFAGIILSGCFCLQQQGFFPHTRQRLSGIVAILLLAIALIYTYGLTPAITDLGFEMARFNGTGEMPPTMMSLHWAYWGLELVKLTLGMTLLRWCYQSVSHWQPLND
ncbi:MAG: hypothetical protein VKL20_08070 [Synechocystis sp.]|nr:hypothetical protein [Synechocystis sp.]